MVIKEAEVRLFRVDTKRKKEEVKKWVDFRQASRKCGLGIMSLLVISCHEDVTTLHRNGDFEMVTK